MLPAPALADFDRLGEEPIAFTKPFDHAQRLAHGGPPRETPWPQLSTLPLENAAITLAAPAQSLFEMPDGLRAALESEALSSRQVEPVASSGPEARTRVASADTGNSWRMGRGKQRAGRGLGRGRDQRHGTSRMAGRGNRTVTPGHQGPLKHFVQVKKRHV
jgi:hypothetical protein